MVQEKLLRLMRGKIANKLKYSSNEYHQKKV